MHKIVLWNNETENISLFCNGEQQWQGIHRDYLLILIYVLSASRWEASACSILALVNLPSMATLTADKADDKISQS